MPPVSRGDGRRVLCGLFGYELLVFCCSCPDVRPDRLTDAPVKHSEARRKTLNHNSLTVVPVFPRWQLQRLGLARDPPRPPLMRPRGPPAESSSLPAEDLKQDF